MLPKLRAVQPALKIEKLNFLPIFPPIVDHFSVYANLGSWTEWSTCSRSCGGGTRSRTRSCDSQAPSNVGAPCVVTDSQTCNILACPGEFYLSCFKGGKWYK